MNPHTRPTTSPIVEVEDLQVVFGSDPQKVVAVDGLSLAIAPGEIVGVVGESGSGKSVTAYALLGLIDFMGGSIVRGSIRYGSCPTSSAWPDWQRVRGRLASMIFQEPMTSLNPLLSIGTQLREAMDGSVEDWRVRAVALLQLVQIREPERRLAQHPHELSGGMRQRVMIAMALARIPALLIADEPTTALDVTVQKEIIQLILRLRREQGLAVLFISHDLALVGAFCDRLLVMYGGHIVEEGPTAGVIDDPRHPYTRLLLRSRPDPKAADQLRLPPIERRRLIEMPGTLRPLREAAQLCRFLDRCPSRLTECEVKLPPWRIDGARRTLCHGV